MPPTMLVCTPLRCEWLAVRATVAGHEVRRTGYGRQESIRAAAKRPETDGLVVAGLAGGTNVEVASGDLVVASEVWDVDGQTVRCPVAPLVAAELRCAGLPVWCGPVASTDAVVSGQGRAELATRGALAADLESAPLLTGATHRPLVVVRAVVDTPRRPLLGPGTPGRALRALARLHRVVGQLRVWARALAAREVVLCRDVDEAIQCDADLVLQFDGAVSIPPNVRRITQVEDVRLAWLAQARTIAVVPSSAGSDVELASVVRVLRGLGPVTRTSCGDEGAASGPSGAAPFARCGQDEAIRFAKEVR